MRFIAFWVAVLAVTAVAAAEAQVWDCTQPPVKDRADSALPCFRHPPVIDADLKVYFAANSPVLGDKARAVLDRQAAALTKSPDIKVALFGHGDDTEPEEIASARAEAVRAYLVSRGVSPDRLVAASRGNRAAIALKPSQEARAAMRFVSTEPR